MFDHVDPNTRYGDETHARGGLIATLARAALERASRDAALRRAEQDLGKTCPDPGGRADGVETD